MDNTETIPWDSGQIWIDRTLYEGRPFSGTGRLEKELRVYDLLDKLGIPYWRVDHAVMPTIEACREVDKVLGTEICKNLFLCNAQIGRAHV